MGLRNRIPHTLRLVLIILLTLSMSGIGYFSGMKGSRNPVASTGLALSFSLVMFLIADLDRPGAELVMIDHVALDELERRLNPWPRTDIGISSSSRRASYCTPAR